MAKTEHKYKTEEEVIREIKRRSINGVAPSTSDTTLRDAAYQYCGSWDKACEKAGVIPRNKAGYNKKQDTDLRREREMTELERFTYLMSYLELGQTVEEIAQEHCRRKETVETEIKRITRERPELVEYFAAKGYRRSMRRKSG